MPISTPRIFLAHAPSEIADIRALHRALEDRWVAVRLSEGSPKAREFIQSAHAFVILLSASSIGNDIVQREVQWALEVHAKRSEMRLIVLLRDLSEGVVPLLFKTTTTIWLPIPQEGLWADDAAKKILEALGLAGKDDHPPPIPEPVPPLTELTHEFSQPKLVMVDDKPRASAMLRLRYFPPSGRRVDGIPTEFVSPLCLVDTEDLRWYIESYCYWPWGPFKDRAKAIEAKIPQWGQMLYGDIVVKQERPMRAFLEAKAVPGERLEKRQAHLPGRRAGRGFSCSAIPNNRHRR